MKHVNTISIITTVYNKAKYIGETIQSVCAAITDNVVEYIIVDDCSTDDSWEIIQTAALRYEFITAVRNQSNLGDYANRSKAVQMTRGAFLKFIDADDLLYPHSLKVFNHAIETHPDCALYISWNIINPPFPFPQKITPRECFRHEFLYENSYLGVGPSAALFNRSVYDQVGGFNSERFMGDTELWRSIALQNNICLVNPSLCFWRKHPQQESQYEQADYSIRVSRIAKELDWLSKAEHFFSESEIKKCKNVLMLRMTKAKLRTLWQK